MKYSIIILVVVVLVGGALYYFTQSSKDTYVNEPAPTTVTDTTTTDETDSGDETEPVDETMTVIGTSVEGNDITAYHYGNGGTNLLFVGGIHGGYSYNTALVAYELMDYFEENPTVIPENVRVTVIPTMNPDGLASVVGSTGRFNVNDVSATQAQKVAGRFNANDVDLNRNFDCEWQEDATWQNQSVSGGSAPFSEPESAAIRDYVNTLNPDAAVVWYSAAGGVFASNCLSGVLPETNELTNLYAEASGYQAYEEFDFYEITGDMVNWFAKNNIPAISVLLTNHDSIEWNKNKAGIDAMLEYYGE